MNSARDWIHLYPKLFTPACEPIIRMIQADAFRAAAAIAEVSTDEVENDIGERTVVQAGRTRIAGILHANADFIAREIVFHKRKV